MRDNIPGRPSPEELLRRVEAEAGHRRLGRLKVFLGYAAGVGKSLRMFDEGRRRKSRGQDVVVAAVQSSEGDIGLEVIPQLPGGALDLEAIRRRRPGVCLIDGLAHRNPPGTLHHCRWQDVEDLLSAGVSVITTINLQYIAEKQPLVEAIRGRRVADSVPERFLLRADEIEIVDAPPEYCVERANAGQPDAASDLLARQLSELREIALVLAAEVVDAQLVRYLQRNGVEQSFGANERILVCITPRSNAALMLHRAQRQAQRFHGQLYAAYVEQPEISPQDRAMLDRNLDLARHSQAAVLMLHGEDVVDAILRCAAAENITQIFVGHSQRTGFWQRLRPNPVERLILESAGVDVRVFPQAESTRREDSGTLEPCQQRPEA
ncbi:MAG: universal stress protein [Acidobacteria bacterium]|nr:universal stress protein [Acidobacteriota bacterium]